MEKMLGLLFCLILGCGVAGASDKTCETDADCFLGEICDPEAKICILRPDASVTDVAEDINDDSIADTSDGSDDQDAASPVCELGQTECVSDTSFRVCIEEGGEIKWSAPEQCGEIQLCLTEEGEGTCVCQDECDPADFPVCSDLSATFCEETLAGCYKSIVKSCSLYTTACNAGFDYHCASEEVRVGNVSENNIFPKALKLPSGNFLVGYAREACPPSGPTTYNFKSGFHIYNQSAFNNVTAPLFKHQVSALNGGGYNDICLIDNYFAIAWDSYPGGNYRINLKVFQENGTPFGGAAFTIANNTLYYDGPKIRATDNNSIFISWLSQGYGTNVHQQVFASDGTPLSSVFQVNNHSIPPDILVLNLLERVGPDRFVVYWVASNMAYTSQSSYLRIFNSRGGPLSSETLIEFKQDTSYPVNVIGGIIPTAANEFMLLWSVSSLISPGKLIATRFGSNGVWLSEKVLELGSYQDHPFYPKGFLSGDRLVISWEMYHLDMADPLNPGISVKEFQFTLFDSNLERIARIFKINESTLTYYGFGMFHSIAPLPDNYFIVAWDSNRPANFEEHGQIGVKVFEIP